MARLKYFSLAVSLWLALGCCAFASSALAEIYTDEMIQKMFHSKEVRQSHDVMLAQRERLKMMLDGFIIGDPELIQTNADELALAMDTLASAYAPKLGQNSAAWNTILQIVTDAQSVKKELGSKNFQKAYAHYSRIVASCVECHQAVRSWGKFETLDPKENRSPVPSSPAS